MRRYFFAVLCALYVLTFIVAMVAFIYFMMWHTTGQWENEEWLFMAIGGLVSGCAALATEIWIYRAFAVWPANPILLVLREIAVSFVFMVSAYLIGSWVSFQATTELATAFPFWMFVPEMAVSVFPKMLPFAIGVGLFNGVLLRSMRESALV